MKFSYDSSKKKKLEFLNQIKNIERVWEKSMQGQNESMLGYHRTSYEGFYGPTPQDFSMLSKSPDDVQKQIMKDLR